MELNTDLPALPKGWVWTKIGEIAYTTSGGTPSRKIKAYFNGNIPWLKSGELKDSFIYNSEETISEEALKNSSAKIFPINTILIALYGATVGRLGILKIEASTNQAICGILNKYNTYYNKYLFYFLMSFRNKLINKRFGGAQPNISQEIVRDVIFPLPPLPEQYRIVNKIEELFTKLDAGVDALKKIKIQLKRYRQAVLKNAFEGKLTQQWREAHKEELEPASVLLEKIKEQRKKESKGKVKELPPIDTSELPELPEGWVWTRVGELIEPNKETVDPKKIKRMPYIGLEHIEKDKGKLLGYGNSNEVKSTKTLFHKGDLLYGKLRPYLNKAIVSDFEGICSTDILVFPSNQFILNKFLLYRFLYSDFSNYVTQRMSGVQHPRINFGSLSEFILAIPPYLEQYKIVEKMETHLSVVDQLENVVEQSLKQAERLRQSILKQAFEGKLVPQDPTDEPAEKLLERIKKEKDSRSLIKQKSRKRK